MMADVDSTPALAERPVGPSRIAVPDTIGHAIAHPVGAHPAPRPAAPADPDQGTVSV
jgi:hypothetical protein